jgi:hypothetical protein
MNCLDRIDQVSRTRLALRLRRSHGDRSEGAKLEDKELTTELDALWREHRTGLAAVHIPLSLGQRWNAAN